MNYAFFQFFVFREYKNNGIALKRDNTSVWNALQIPTKRYQERPEIWRNGQAMVEWYPTFSGRIDLWISLQRLSGLTWGKLRWIRIQNIYKTVLRARKNMKIWASYYPLLHFSHNDCSANNTTTTGQISKISFDLEWRWKYLHVGTRCIWKSEKLNHAYLSGSLF